MELSPDDFTDDLKDRASDARAAVSGATQRVLVLGEVLSVAPHCPECGGEMEETYVRAPHEQRHWRGVRAEQCTECGYAERLERAPE